MAHGTPRRLRMKREARLQSAKRWLPTYRGRDVVKGYRKWYGVSAVCAIIELRMLGVPIDESRLEQARATEAGVALHRARRKQQRESAGRSAFGPDYEFWEMEFAFDEGERDDDNRKWEPEPPFADQDGGDGEWAPEPPFDACNGEEGWKPGPPFSDDEDLPF